MKKGLALTRELVREAIDLISFVNAVIPTSVSMTQKQLRVLISTRDRNNGDPTTLQVGWSFPREGISTRQHAISWIVACVRESWVHELHESVFFDGTRLSDLHVPGTTKTKPPPPDLVDPWWKWKALAQDHSARKRGRRASRAAPYEKTMRAFALPDGWTWEPRSTGVVVKAPAGSAMIDFAERVFDLAFDALETQYTGQNWRRTLVADAIVALRSQMPRHS